MAFSPATIRPLEPEDIPTVADIAQASMAYPWSERVFRDCMKANYYGWVMSDDSVPDGRVLGFVIVLIELEECQLLNVCVSEDDQRCGFGRQLMEHMIAHAKSERIYRISLEVRASNTAAISIYHALGFIDVGLRKNYYPKDKGDNDREDALIMVLEIN